MVSPRVLSSIAALPVAAALASCSAPPPPVAAVPAAQLAQPHPSWNGLKVASAQAGAVPAGTVGQALGLHVYEFRATARGRDWWIDAKLLCWHGTKVENVDEICVGAAPGNKRDEARWHVSVALYPDGDDWYRSSRVFAIMATEGVYTKRKLDNPFKRATMTSFGGPDIQPDGSFRLAWGTVKPPATATSLEHDVGYTLVIRAIKSKRPSK